MSEPGRAPPISQPFFGTWPRWTPSN